MDVLILQLVRRFVIIGLNENLTNKIDYNLFFVISITIKQNAVINNKSSYVNWSPD